MSVVGQENLQMESKMDDVCAMGGVFASQGCFHEPPRLAIVLPCFDEEESVPVAYAALSRELASLEAAGDIACGWKVVFVDDGSSDGTAQAVLELVPEGHVALVRLARNYGQQPAVIAGYAACLSAGFDAVVSMDADMQDDPAALPAMVCEYLCGADVVVGERVNRSSDSLAKRLSSRAYYAVAGALGVPFDGDSAEHRLLSARALRVLAEHPERDLYLRATVASLGLLHASVPVARLPRRAGKSKYGLPQMLKLALSSVRSFSTRPLELLGAMGAVFVAISLFMAAWAVVQHVSGTAVSGWASAMVSMWFIGGCLMAGLGLVGDYVAAVLVESKRRPRFVVESVEGLDDGVQ